MFDNFFSVFFRTGDLLDEEALLHWLTDIDSMESADHIENVNRVMLKKILKDNDDVAVFYYSDNCKQCEKAIVELEKIDDEAHALDIDFVKINDAALAKQNNIHAFPALIYYKAREPIIFAGDMRKSEQASCRNLTHSDQNAS